MELKYCLCWCKAPINQYMYGTDSWGKLLSIVRKVEKKRILFTQFNCLKCTQSVGKKNIICTIQLHHLMEKKNPDISKVYMYIYNTWHLFQIFIYVLKTLF